MTVATPGREFFRKNSQTPNCETPCVSFAILMTLRRAKLIFVALVSWQFALFVVSGFPGKINSSVGWCRLIVQESFHQSRRSGVYEVVF